MVFRQSEDVIEYDHALFVGIMDAFNDPQLQEINFVKSTRVGGSEALLSMFGYIILQSPAPCMIVYPTSDLSKDTSSDAFTALF